MDEHALNHKILELEEKNYQLEQKIKSLNSKLIGGEESLKIAKDKAYQLETLAKRQYDREMDRLYIYIGRWNTHAKAIKSAFGSSAQFEKTNELINSLNDIFEQNYSKCKNLNSKDIINQASNILKNTKPIKSKESIILGDGENAFSLDEITNPSNNLDLAELCKQLGLMED